MNFSQRHSHQRLHPKKLILHILNEQAMFGEPCSSSYQSAHHVLKRIEMHEPLKINSLFSIANKLEETLLHWMPNKYAVLQLFWDLDHEINDLAKRDFDNLNRPCRVSENARGVRDETLQLIVEVLQRFIASYTFFPRNAADKLYTVEKRELNGIALEILHNICVEFEEQAKYCGESDIFLNCLFSCLQYDETCFPACRLLECLMHAMKKVFDLSIIETPQRIMRRLSDVQLGNFCKILAITLSELDMFENKTLLHAQMEEVKTQTVYTRDTNQDIVLGTTTILARIVKIACAKPFIPWSGVVTTGMVQREQWLQWIENQCNQELFSDEVVPFVGGISTWSESSVYGPCKTSLKMTLELTIRADAICVLGLLLVGMRRKDVQKKLTELRLIPQLSDMFDHFVWHSHSGLDLNRLPGHNSACECSPEVALKIQLLRLIHSFCDHSEYKLAMLSWNEYSELLSIEGKPNHPTLFAENESTAWINRDTMCSGSKGLLTKIVEVVGWETGASTFRFWLSRSIESFLRGSCSGADQDFLLRRKLLQHVVQNLLTTNPRHKEVLQSSFDLLGELMKFNVHAFIEFDSYIDSPAKQRKLLSLINSSLVDSNMFIRSIILTYELFLSSGTAYKKDHPCDEFSSTSGRPSISPSLLKFRYPRYTRIPEEQVTLCYRKRYSRVFVEEDCYVLSYVGSVRMRINYLHRLLSLINVPNLTQENVSCLNTALVILMFGLQKGELPTYLNVLASNVESCNVATSNGTVYLENLREMLLFWQEHYLQKDKDCSILEKGSRICFQEWNEAVCILTSNDHKNPCSISYYTREACSSRAS